jgi:hypothetical protein
MKDGKWSRQHHPPDETSWYLVETYGSSWAVGRGKPHAHAQGGNMPIPVSKAKAVDLDPYQVIGAIVDLTVDKNGNRWDIIECESFGTTSKEEAQKWFDHNASFKPKPKQPTVILLVHLLGVGRATVWECKAAGFKQVGWARDAEREFKMIGAVQTLLDLPTTKKAPRSKKFNKPGVELVPQKRIKPPSRGLGATMGSIPA